MNLARLLVATISAIIISTTPALIRTGESGQQTQQPTTAAANASASRNWAGYATTNGTFTGVGATWSIPTETNNNANFGTDATWVGLGGVQTADLIQAGTQEAVDGNGQVTYSAFYEGLPHASRPLPVKVTGGDSITVSINQEPNTDWHISFKDNTNGQTAAITVSYTSSLSSADWIEEAPSTTRRILPIDNFGSIAFHNAWTISNGQKKTLAQTNPQAINMGDDYGQTLATASTIGNDGASFTVQRTNTSPAVSTDDNAEQSAYIRHHIQPYIIHVRHIRF